MDDITDVTFGAVERSEVEDPKTPAVAERFGGKKLTIVSATSLLFLTVLPLVPLDPKFPEASKGLAVLLTTALFWVTEIMPLSVSSLLPMALYPLFGIVKASELAGHYFSGTTFLFIAGFFLGLSIERWNLHTRFVHAILSMVSGRVELYLAAFMLCTWLLSMWISNTATMLCILPILKSFQDSVNGARFQRGMLLAIGYAATIGGLATPVGTPMNGIFMTLFQEFWPQEEEFSFASFCIIALPLSATLLVVTYVFACATYIWTSNEQVEVTFERRPQPKVSFEEGVVLLDLLCLMCLWFTASRIDRFPGWKHSLGLAYLNSGSIGLLLTLPLFLIPCGRWLPSVCRQLLGEERCESRCRDPSPKYILDWDVESLLQAHQSYKCSLCATVFLFLERILGFAMIFQGKEGLQLGDSLRLWWWLPDCSWHSCIRLSRLHSTMPGKLGHQRVPFRSLTLNSGCIRDGSCLQHVHAEHFRVSDCYCC